MAGLRVFFASILALIWVALVDGVARTLSESAVPPSSSGTAVVFASALLIGCIIGIALGGIVAISQVSGPARSMTSGAIEDLSTAPWWMYPIMILAFVAPVAVAVPIRASFLEKSIIVSAGIDLLALVIGWLLALQFLKRFGARSGWRISRKIAGWGFAGLGVITSVVFSTMRPALDSAALWNLVLVGECAIVGLGVAFLLPSAILQKRIAVVCVLLTVVAGGIALWSLQVSEDIRDEVASDWRPASWLVVGLTTAVDMDSDGFSPLFGGGDCDDLRDDVNPDGIEIAGNGIDENCFDGDSETEPPWPPRPTFVPLPDGLREPRSILLITVDALRQDHLGIYGYPRPTSPRIDALAAQGVRFANARSSAPTTRIAIPVLHTGHLISEIPWDRSVFPYAMRDNIDTVAEILKKERGLKTAAFVTHRYLGREWGFVQGFDHVDEDFNFTESTYRKRASGAGLAEHVVKWISENRDDRFFVWVHFLDPHERYIKHDEAPDFGNSDVDRYDSEIWYDDKYIGVILDKLEEFGIADDTMVALLADHGEYFGEHGKRNHGGSLYKENTRIPLIVRSPGLSPRVVQCITGHIDLPPTMLNLMGIDGGKYGMSGASAIPDMTGAPCPSDRQIVMEIRYGPRSAPNVRGLVGHEWKLVQNVHLGTYRLYNILKDPGELRNLARRNRSKFREMKKQLLSWTEVYSNRELVDIIKQLTFDRLPDGAEHANGKFENGMEVVGMDFGDRQISVNLRPNLQLYMRTKKRVDARCKAVFSFVDNDGETRVESWHRFLHGTLPVKRWPLGRVVKDGFVFRIARGKLKPGKYGARMGLKCDKKRIPAVSGNIDENGRVRLGEFQVIRDKKR
ncbi:MAG: sulfatase-like hydrolase/transferase [Proteobacteria bacterium]|nr:sulfatase-like hydrolase/transferase [Pseudomonadota bacterium]